MEAIGPILNIFNRLWDCVAQGARTVKDLKTNQKALQTALEQLKGVSEDVKTRVKLAEERRLEPTEQVRSWLQMVEHIDKTVTDVLKEASQISERSCCLRCPNECWSSYNLAEELKEKLTAVQELMRQGNFESVAKPIPRGVADERPLGDTVGLNLAFERVQIWIRDSTVKVIGIHGLGGVGKTTLLKKINNSFLGTNYGFDRVIWIVVSRPSSVEKVQDALCEQLKLSEDVWKNKSEHVKQAEIFKILCRRKFVLMLDDVWEGLDLIKVSVPALDDPRMPKVVFTTRSEDVCSYMRSNQTIELECLAKDEALDLFKKNVGTNTLNAHPNIQNYVGILANECKGLPLAIITVGRAMIGKPNPSDWERAIKKIQKDPSTIAGVQDDVFHILKFSYDSLRNETIKSCFVYCCIYPKDHEIDIDHLLDLWIGEGFLDEFDDIHKARGQDIIDDLLAASLLESGKSKKKVKMHDIIHDMALWISGGCKGKTNRYLVQDNVGLLEAQLGTRTMETERVSLWNNAIGITTEVRHSWSNIITFLVRPRPDHLETIFYSGFLLSMPVLKVLDLSFNDSLRELPPMIGELVELQFLNISHTRIRELPVELKNFTKMKYLLLEWTFCIVIPPQVISSFSLLRVFRLFGIRYNVASNNNAEHDIKLSGNGLLEELECLPHINDVSITLFDVTSIEKLMGSPKLLNCLSSLQIHECKGLNLLEISTLSMERMQHLQRLNIYDCELQWLRIFHTGDFTAHGRFHNLREVIIFGCNSLLDMMWLIYAPMLEYLSVSDCQLMVDIVGYGHVTGTEDAGSSMFSQLREIWLYKLPCLKSVCGHALLFPSLVEINVDGCPKLRRLPLNSTSAQGSLKEIRGGQSWWNGLEWDDKTLEPLFRSYFVPWQD